MVEIGGNPSSKHQIQPESGEWADSRGTGRLIPSREIIFSGANGDRDISFSVLADHEQD